MLIGHKSRLTNDCLDSNILRSNITVQKLLINLSARTIDNNVDVTPPPTTEGVNLSDGPVSRQEPFISNTHIPNSMNMLPEIISEGNTSRREPDGLSVGHASLQGPLFSNISVPNTMNVLPATISEGYAS